LKILAMAPSQGSLSFLRAIFSGINNALPFLFFSFLFLFIFYLFFYFMIFENPSSLAVRTKFSTHVWFKWFSHF